MTNGFTRIAAGHYRHAETGIEIVKVPAHREHGYNVGVRWQLRVPMEKTKALRHVGTAGTLKATIAWAVGQHGHVEVKRAAIAMAWDEAHASTDYLLDVLVRPGVSLDNAGQEAQQIREWWMRHGLDKLPSITAEDVLAARDADHAEAHAEAAERSSFSQNYAWAARHDLPSGRREHIQAAINADHAEAHAENAWRADPVWRALAGV